MNFLKFSALAICLAGSLPMLAAAPVSAETAAPAAKPDTTKAAAPAAKTDEDKDDSSMSETDKRAKAIDCSKQADAKKLHGEARKKFRSSCKHGK